MISISISISIGMAVEVLGVHHYVRVAGRFCRGVGVLVDDGVAVEGMSGDIVASSAAVGSTHLLLMSELVVLEYRLVS